MTVHRESHQRETRLETRGQAVDDEAPEGHGSAQCADVGQVPRVRTDRRARSDHPQAAAALVFVVRRELGRARVLICRELCRPPRRPGWGTATIYVLHFTKPIDHRKHYVGYTTDLDRRLAQHRSGEGAKLVGAVMRSGGNFVLALALKVPFTRAQSVERYIKTHGSGMHICPLCTDFPAIWVSRAHQDAKLLDQLNGDIVLQK